MAYFAAATRPTTTTTRSTYSPSFPWLKPLKLYRLAKFWFHQIFLTSPFLPLIFVMTAMITFITITWLAVTMYGDIALQEGLLYHFSRVDHRHNYSMYWYWIYLARAKVADTNMMTLLSSSSEHAINAANATTATTTVADAMVGMDVMAATSSSSSLATMGRLLLLPQVFLLAYSSFGIAPHNNQLGLALFVQTYVFVTHNKVITAQ